VFHKVRLVQNNCDTATEINTHFMVNFLMMLHIFNSVVHFKLLHKFSSFGINGLLLKWIEAFLYCFHIVYYRL